MTFLLFILKLIVAVVLFLVIEWLAYKITEVWYEKIFNKFPFLDHQPWNCRICCQFWSNLFACAAFWFATHWTFASVTWLVLTILETIALKVAENNRYIEDDYDGGEY